MKSVAFTLLCLSMLSLLGGCGKDNESGKKSSYSSNNPYGYGNPYHNGNFQNITNTGLRFGNVSVDHVLQQTPCLTTGMPNQARLRVQIPMTGFPSVVPAGDVYVGVTTAGDVAAFVGQGNNAPLFIAFMCQRPYSQSGQGVLMDFATGTSSKCHFKPIVRATMMIPGSQQPLFFRWLDGGRLNPQSGQIFPYTQPVCVM